MDVAGFIARARSDLSDVVGTPLWTDADLIGYLNEAVADACERANLIIDRTSSAAAYVGIFSGIDNTDLHASVIRVMRVQHAGSALDESSIEAEDRLDGRWETRSGIPKRWIADGPTRIRLSPMPNDAAVAKAAGLQLMVSRRQLTPFALNNLTEVPEIEATFHERILDGIYARAYMKRHAETINEAKAVEHEAKFTASFGMKIDANVRQKQRDRRPPVVRCRFP